MAVAEIDYQDLWQRAALAAVTVSSDHVHAEKVLRRSRTRRRHCSAPNWRNATVEWLAKTRQRDRMDERRTFRVSEAVREELTEIIGFETEDPAAARRRGGRGARQPRRAACTVRVAGPRHRAGAEGVAWPPWITPATISATSWPRASSLRHVPELHFNQDRNPDVESRIDFLLKRAKKSVVVVKNRAKLKQSVIVLFVSGALCVAVGAFAQPPLLRLEKSGEAMGSTYTVDI